MAQAPVVVRVEFDRVRKLKPKHRYLREAVRTSGKSITELMMDPFGGFPYLLQALLTPSANQGESITLDKASELIDLYLEKEDATGKKGTIEGLQKALVESLSAYLHIETTPTSDEDEEAHPNAPAPAEPGSGD